MLAFECLNFTLGGSLIRGLVRKLAIRHPQNQCKIFTLGGSLIPSLCQNLVSSTRKSRTNVRQAVDEIRLSEGGGFSPSTPFLLSIGNLALQCVDEVADRLALLPHLRTDFSEDRNEVWENLLRLQEHFFV